MVIVIPPMFASCLSWILQSKWRSVSSAGFKIEECEDIEISGQDTRMRSGKDLKQSIRQGLEIELDILPALSLHLNKQMCLREVIICTFTPKVFLWIVCCDG